MIDNIEDFSQTKWTLQYIENINKGIVVVPKSILKLIEILREKLKKYIYVQAEVDRRINFIEHECAQTKGSHELLKLHPTQKFWLECVYGYFIEYNSPKDYKRLIHEVPIMVSRGTGKTTLAATFANIGILLDNEYGADVQCFGTTKEQASLLFDTTYSMINKDGTILKQLKDENLLINTRKDIRFKPFNSVMKIKAADYKKLDGTNCHYNIFDELHAYEQDFIKVVNDGSMKKRKNWISFYITTNGTIRENVFDRYYKKWKKILNKEIIDDSVCPILYELDSKEEVNDERCWQKAIPLINFTTPIEIIRKDVKASKDDPIDQAELMAKTFNLPVTNTYSYFTYEECLGNNKLFENEIFKGNDYEKVRCIIGFDLSEINDITAVSFMTKKNDKFYFKNIKILPDRSISMMPLKKQQQYKKWIDEGELITHDEDFNNADIVFSIIKDFVDKNNLAIVGIGYDEWHAKELVKKIKQTWPCEIDKIRQGAQTLSDPMKQFKILLSANKIIFNSDLDSWNMGNVKAFVDNNNNIKPSKSKHDEKIDVFASMLDAFTFYKKHEEQMKLYF